ncbi:hypothetical protein P6709_09295 [Jeotgalibacillus sp. ET6]|uniref:hypothetical protein n=1 Tax=Jeotgalibacillus sp. ET6 TaxID=3037260 RepID=UPI00241875A2|nr:hypothetical protein [Jeotgalibacillus sp. ET6]MDG5471943.1 hypothetical protein [Jeotgalibacillus sp. ET6]
MNSAICLSHEELTAALDHCGYDCIAEDTRSFFNLTSKVDTDFFAKSAGFSNELENIFTNLKKSHRKIRWIQENGVKFIHFIEGESMLIQEVKNGEHRFSYRPHSESLCSALQGWYEFKGRKLIDDMEFLTIELTTDSFDELHQMSPDYVKEVMKDRSAPPAFRQFLYDFNLNKKELDNFSFLFSSEGKMKLEQVIFFLPSEECVWFIDYQNVENDQIFIKPFFIHEFLFRLEDQIRLFASKQGV